MISYEIFCAVTNSAGLTVTDTSKSIIITDEQPALSPIIDSINISPSEGPRGTLFTITINAHDPNVPSLPFTYDVFVRPSNGGLSQTLTQISPGVFTWQS